MNKSVLIEKEGRNLKIVVFNKEGGVESMFEQVVPVDFQISFFEDMKAYLDCLPSIVGENIFKSVTDIFDFGFGETRKYEYIIFDDGGYEETVHADGEFLLKVLYNNKNNIVKFWHSEDEWQESEYDDRGNLIFQKFSNGEWNRAFYNERNQTIFEGESNGKWRAWTYDNDGHLVEFFDSCGFSQKNNRISENLTISTNSDGETIEFDDLGSFRKTTDADGFWDYREFNGGEQTYYEDYKGVIHGKKREK